MSEVEAPAVDPAAKGQLLLASVDAETAQALHAAMTQELLSLCKDEAVHEARRQLDAEYADRRERLYDAVQAEREQLAKDLKAVERAEWEQQLAREQEGYADHLDQVRTRLREWKSRAETSEHLLTNLLTQLCGGVDRTPVYLRSISGEGLAEVDKHTVNAVLGRHGLQLKSKSNASSRTVAVTIEPGKVQPHSVFWLTKAPVPGVVDADAEAAAAR
jgi:hypothetical protein